MLGKTDSQVSEFKDYGIYIERNKKKCSEMGLGARIVLLN
jgi:hypothetical protein